MSSTTGTISSLASTTGNIGTLNSNLISYINEQIDNEIVTSTMYYVSLSTKKLTILAATSNMTVNLSILMPSYCLNNIFEFRVLTSPSVTFQTPAQACIMIDLANDIQRSMTYTTQNHFRFYYTYYNNYYTYILLGAE